MCAIQVSDINRRNVSFGLLRVYKDLVQKTGLARYDGPTTVVLIQGCQRSGTSLTYWIFERDFNAKIYRESSSLSSNDTAERLRLNPLDDVKAVVAAHNVPLVVLKPLVESQRAPELLEQFDGARVLWLYRHYQDVASSNLKAFGMDNGLNDIRPFVTGEPGNWRSENSSDETRAIIRRHFAEDMNPYDAAALFWFARNQLFFEQGLDDDPRAMLCRYEDLVTRPSEVMRRVYDFVDMPYPGDHIVQDVHPQSVGKGRTSRLSPEVDALCADLLDRLDAVNQRTVLAGVGESDAPTQTS